MKITIEVSKEESTALNDYLRSQIIMIRSPLSAPDIGNVLLNRLEVACAKAVEDG